LNVEVFALNPLAARRSALPLRSLRRRLDRRWARQRWTSARGALQVLQQPHHSGTGAALGNIRLEQDSPPRSAATQPGRASPMR
jgi:hypothetical protein